jgi:xylulokinase
LVPTRPGTSVVYDDLVEAAERACAGAEGLFFLPHLMGERGPAEDPLARGALIGFTLRHGHDHLARAVLEGTVFQLRRVLDGSGAPVAPVSGVASGGVAHSRAWMQLIADITRLSLRVPEVVESGAMGAAMLGAAAAGLLPLDVAEKRMTHPGPTYTPHPVRANEYDPIYARYRELDDLLAPWFRGELSQ